MSNHDAIAALRQIAQLDDTTQRPEEDIDALYHNERTLREVVWTVRAFLKAYDARPVAGDEQVERVARALLDGQYVFGNQDDAAEAREIARAAIAALQPQVEETEDRPARGARCLRCGATSEWIAGRGS